MVEFTKNGKELVHAWVPKQYEAPKVHYATTLTKEENDLFLECFGSVNRNAFIKILILKAIEEKRNGGI